MVMEQPGQIAVQKPVPQEVPQPRPAKNPAQKWLILSAVGVAICLAALGFYFIRGNSGSTEPLPNKVLNQVFGFTPYYFTKDNPPDHLHLQKQSPIFIGNALTLKLNGAKQEIITMSQKAVPTPTPKADGESATTSLGTAIIKIGGGHIKASLTTADKTYITLNASDYISSGTMIDIYNNLTAVSKDTTAQQ